MLIGCILLDITRYRIITDDENVWMTHRLNRHFAMMAICCALIGQHFASYAPDFIVLCKFNDFISFGCYFYLIGLLYFWSAAIHRKMFLFNDGGELSKIYGTTWGRQETPIFCRFRARTTL